ncbi:MAG: hypothetical protein EKK64_06820 [Neisseriaceae bacterium]|nr:MAG: hypothetical protein EKK64_06820 [Neisseriaceae bacterium]
MTKARRWDNRDWPEWLNRAWDLNSGTVGALQVTEGDRELLEIVTLEGIHRITWDDWIIQGINGELYPCKPDIFEKTYEQAT